MHDYGHYALLVGRIPVFLLASTCTEYELYLCIQPRKAKFFHQRPPYLPICGISLPLLVICSCATFKTFKILSLVPLVALLCDIHADMGNAINITFLVEHHVSCYAFLSCLK